MTTVVASLIREPYCKVVAPIQHVHPILQALLATCFTWSMTALGAAVVFLARRPSRKLLDGMLGFAGGVMIAASYWSLRAPAIRTVSGATFP